MFAASSFRLGALTDGLPQALRPFFQLTRSVPRACRTSRTVNANGIDGGVSIGPQKRVRDGSSSMDKFPGKMLNRASTCWFV
jgi:hypothetical protein